jgi:hypothetical protein
MCGNCPGFCFKCSYSCSRKFVADNHVWWNQCRNCILCPRGHWHCILVSPADSPDMAQVEKEKDWRGAISNRVCWAGCVYAYLYTIPISGCDHSMLICTSKHWYTRRTFLFICTRFEAPFLLLKAQSQPNQQYYYLNRQIQSPMGQYLVVGYSSVRGGRETAIRGVFLWVEKLTLKRVEARSSILIYIVSLWVETCNYAQRSGNHS